MFSSSSTRYSVRILGEILPLKKRPNSGTTAYKGHVVTLPHIVQHIVKNLPRYVTDFQFCVSQLKRQRRIVYIFKSGEILYIRHCYG